MLDATHFAWNSPRPTGLRHLGVALSALLALGMSASAHAQSGFGDSSWGDAQDFFDEDEDEDDGDYEQPPVTAGGLFTKDTYPVAEIERPLTITEGIAEVRASLDFDLSANRAFEVFYTRLNGRYGLRDHLELQASFDGLLSGEISPLDVASGRHQAAMSLGVESAIAYDVVNLRATAEIPLRPESTLDLALGVPVRYRVTSELAIIAADRILTVHTDGRKPDLTLGLGALYQILPDLAALARAELTLFEFNTDLDPIVPVTAAIQYSPNHLFDVGLEVAFGNLAASDGRFDQRFALLFGRLRL